MMMGYYDRNGYANMYAGPANSGVCPLNNVTFWGNSSLPGGDGECPLSATHMGKDGRAIRGHVDDYWIDYGNAGPDPWIVHGWTQHTQGECTGDYMGTNQSSFTSYYGPNTDGSTIFYFGSDGVALSNYTGCEPSGRDGCHGMRLFAESRGYTVTANFSQYIYPNPTDPTQPQGFTFANFQTEIDAGRPVLIQVEGHTMLGYGYDSGSSTIYIHDTWDNLNHSMTWGGSYSGMLQYGVTVLRLAASGEPPIVPVTLDYPSDTGIAFERGQSYVIRWHTQTEELTTKTPMQITLQDGDGHSWILAPSVPNTGSWLWKAVGTWKSKTGQAPYPDGDQYRISVSTVSGGAVDMSDSPFAIGHVTSLTVNGSTSIVGGALPQPQYTCTGHLNFGGDLTVTPAKWACTKIKGVKMGKTGLLATLPVTGADVPCTITASYGKGTAAIIGTLPIVITP